MSQELPFQEWTNGGAPTTTESAFRRDGPAPNKSEAAKLLELSTESESEPEPLQLVPPKRKVRFRKRLRGARGLVLTGGPHSGSACCGGSSEGCFSMVKVIGFLLGVAILVAQAWFLLSVRSRLDHLYTIYRQNMDVDGKKLPAQLHDLHAQIKGLEQNLSSTATELHRTAADLVALAKQVADLKATTGSLQESVASAPQIKGLPSAVTDLKQNVANLGSQVSSLENGLQALKEQHNSLQVLRKDIDQVKEQVQRISNASAVAVDDQSSTHTSLHDLEQSVQQCLGEVRAVVDQRLVGLESGLKEVHTATENHTDILLRQQTQLEGVLNCTHTCPADLSPENLSLALDQLLSPNATVNGSAVVGVLKEAGHLGTIYHGLQAQLGVNHSASDEVAELLQRATLYSRMPPSHHSPQLTATSVQPAVSKQLNSSEGDTGQKVAPPVQTSSTTKRP
uniref:Secreted 45 kDa protein n=1 Tax=Rhipicephalus zambeziensis TaxID=60191 RepID=A0A224Z870_9ACAR